MLPLLLVDDDRRERQALKRRAGSAFDVIACESCAEAMAFNFTVPSAIVIALQMADGNGYELAKLLQIRFRNASIALVGQHGSAHALALGARFIPKPPTLAAIDDFLSHAVCMSLGLIRPLQDAIYSAARGWNLRPHETLVLGTSLKYERHDMVARELRLNANTMKSRIKQILAKSNCETMLQARTRVLTSMSALPKH